VSDGLTGNHDDGRRTGVLGQLRDYLLSGLIVIGPTALSLWVLVKLFNWLDGLLGEYLRFHWFEYRRIPGLGFVAMVLVLLLTGWLAHVFAGFAVVRTWDRLLARIPLFRLIYTPVKRLGEALLGGKRNVFERVVLVQWPHPGVWVMGFVTGTPPQTVSDSAGCELLSVFVPKTPNPTSGFYQLVPRDSVVPLDLTVEQGIQMVVSGGVVGPGDPATN
jgi:uncharacterized membrane protein